MKNPFRILRLLWTLKRRERDAQIQRFELLEQYLRCCSDHDHLYEFDKQCDKVLKPNDVHTLRYDIMMARRFRKDKAMCRNEHERRWARIKEGERILSKYKL